MDSTPSLGSMLLSGRSGHDGAEAESEFDVFVLPVSALEAGESTSLLLWFGLVWFSSFPFARLLVGLLTRSPFHLRPPTHTHTHEHTPND